MIISHFSFSLELEYRIQNSENRIQEKTGDGKQNPGEGALSLETTPLRRPKSPLGRVERPA
jgi:hypothetical protein